MDLKIYIHGIPYGFKYNGSKEDYDVFFQRYYKKLRNINEMRIEVIPMGKETYYYYSYILGKNIFDRQNDRPGSYFGITVRLDHYYKRAVNLYYLLDSFFHSYLDGRILEYRDFSYKFLTEDFNKINFQSDLEKLISMTFSSDDLLTIEVKRQNDYERINISDADDDFVLKSLMTKGEVSISQSYPSKSTEKILSQKNAEIEQLKYEAERLVNRIKLEKKTEIDKINETYKDADITIRNQTSKIESYSKQVNDLNLKVASCDKLLKAKDDQINSAEQKIEKYGPMQEVMDHIKNELDNIYNYSESNYRKDTNDTISPNKQIFSFSRLYKVLNIVLLFIIIFFVPHYISNTSSLSKGDIETIRTIVQDGYAQINTDIQTSKPLEQPISGKKSYPKYARAKIDIKEFHDNNSSMKINTMYHVSIKNIEKGISGQLISSSGHLFIKTDNKGNSIMYSDQKGTYKIQYVVNTDTVLTRTVNVMK